MQEVGLLAGDLPVPVSGGVQARVMLAVDFVVKSHDLLNTLCMCGWDLHELVERHKQDDDFFVADGVAPQRCLATECLVLCVQGSCTCFGDCAPQWRSLLSVLTIVCRCAMLGCVYTRAARASRGTLRAKCWTTTLLLNNMSY